MKIKIAFLCLAHNNFEYIEHLSQYYCSDGDALFLHIDKAINTPKLTKLHPATRVLDNTERYRTRWGTLNIALASLKLLDKALKDSEYNRFILVSGADTPLFSKKDLKEKLISDFSYLSVWDEISREDQGKLHDEFFKRHFYHSRLTNPGEAYLTQSRPKIYLMLLLNKLISFLPLKKNFHFKSYAKGSQWWCLTRELAEYILNSSRKENTLTLFEHMHAPDEKTFQTLALNSPLRAKIQIDIGQEKLKQGLHYIDWGLLKEKKGLQNFTPDKIQTAKNLGCYFARKVDKKDFPYFINYIQQLKNL